MSQLSKKLLELAQKQNDFFKAPLTIEDMSDEENTKSETLNKKRRFEATPTRDVSASKSDLSGKLNESTTKKGHLEHTTKYKNSMYLDNLSQVYGSSATSSQQSNTTDSSNEQLNEKKTKSAYLEVMKKCNDITNINLEDIHPLGSERATTSMQKINMSGLGSSWLSQEQLNKKKTKEIYMEFMKECKDIDFTLSKREKAKKGEKFTKKQKNLKKSTLKLEKNGKNPNQNRGQKKIKKTVIPKYIQHWYKLQDSRNIGLYVLCDTCNKVRYLPDIKDPLDLSEKWYCHMNLNKNYNKCEDPEEEIKDKEYVIDNMFNAGSIVWAKLGRYPWWPAMVDDDPNIEDYFWIEESTIVPVKYHVTFFNSTRAWLYTKDIKPFKINMNNPTYTPSKYSKYKKQINVDIEEAIAATELPLIERLRKYSFVTQNFNNQLRKSIRSKKCEEIKPETSSLKKQKEDENKTLNKKHSLTSNDSDNLADIIKDIDLSMEDPYVDF